MSNYFTSYFRFTRTYTLGFKVIPENDGEVGDVNELSVHYYSCFLYFFYLFVCFFFFSIQFLNLRPLQDCFSSYETGQSVG